MLCTLATRTCCNCLPYVELLYFVLQGEIQSKTEQVKQYKKQVDQFRAELERCRGEIDAYKLQADEHKHQVRSKLHAGNVVLVSLSVT